MSWTDDTGRHEGHVKMVFADGKLGGGIYSTVGVSVDGLDRQGLLDEFGTPRESRPAAAVVGWRVACNHVTNETRTGPVGWADPPGSWISPTTWRRVYSPAEENFTERCIYASLDDEGSVFIADREDLDDLIRAEWRRHIEPEDHARSIRAAMDGVAKAKQLLDLEVAAAHAAGMSWAEIGNVAGGITRQAARERWGTR